MCIRVLGNNRKYAGVGDIIGVVKDAPEYGSEKIKYCSCSNCENKTIKRSDGMAVRFDDNAVIINAENNPRGTRIWSRCQRNP
jgi:large subunit ribosomal protein L14